MQNRRTVWWIASVLLPAILTMTSCGTMKSKRVRTLPDVANTATAIPDTLPEEEARNVESRRIHEIEHYSIDEVLKVEEPNTSAAYDNSRYDFPVTMNSRVEGWIDYFTGRGRPHMERYLARSSRYIPVMKQILKREGLPEDLVYLALIESGFNVRAKSRAKAVGPWQFIKATGRRYGLRVDGWVDERQDPIRSTEAAAAYLKDLYLMFESWYLAAAAYNAGEYKILRSISSTKTNNFWSIAQTNHIRRETKDYVPKLIAAAIIAKNPDKYQFEDIAYLDPLEYETVSVNFPVSMKKISELVDAPEDEILDLNPHLRRGSVPPNVASHEVRIPVGSRAVVERAVAAMRASLVPGGSADREYLVRRGDTLSTIARRHRIRKNDLASVNNLSTKEKLQPGMSLIIPKGAKPEAYSEPKTGDSTTHVVQRGDSLWSIAEQYDVRVADILDWNDLDNARIFPGKKLTIQGSAAAMGPREAKRTPQAVPAVAGPSESGFLDHTVQSGETLWSIAEKYSVSVRQLYRWNSLRRSRIQPGEVLKVKAERGSRANQIDSKARPRNAKVTRKSSKA